MEQLSSMLTQEQVNAFYSIDRDIYAILTVGLSRDPIECMQIVAFWYWLEILSISEFIFNIGSLPWALINELANEAVICLSCINSDVFVPSLAEIIDGGIPLTVAVLDKDYITIPYLFKHRVEAREKIAREYNRVCVHALSDIMYEVLEKNARHAATAMHVANSSTVVAEVPHLIGSMSSMTLQPPTRTEQQQQLDGGNEKEDAENRTLFATFSKGYPVVARELKDFLVKNFGADCIESLHMQDVMPPKQSLYARIVFRFGATMNLILNGMDKVKFNINGKHVWARKYVPYKRLPTKSDNITQSSTSTSAASTSTISSTN